jgi:hypothetical protein
MKNLFMALSIILVVSSCCMPDYSKKFKFKPGDVAHYKLDNQSVLILDTIRLDDGVHEPELTYTVRTSILGEEVQMGEEELVY